MTKKEMVTKYLYDYRDKLEKGEISKTHLARMIYYDGNNKHAFSSIDSIRSCIRELTGAKGNKDKVHPKDVFISNTKKGQKYITVKMPKSASKPRKPFVIPNSVTKLLVFGDVHLPFHDEQALNCMFDFVKDKSIDGILINGDLLDFVDISRFVRVGRDTTTADEMKAAKQFFAYVRSLFPDIPIYFKLGNHEERYDIFLTSKAPQLLGIKDYELSSVLALDSFNIKMIPSRTLVSFNEIYIVHGHEFGESVFSPVNPARGLFNRAKCSAVTNHHHQSSVHNESNLRGESLVCYSLGCMCDLSPDYRPFAFTKWNHGFAILSRESKRQTVIVKNHVIEKGEVKL